MTAELPRPELAAEIEDLRARLTEAEEALRAIRNGEVDAVVVAGEGGEKVYTLHGAEGVYRQLVETMSEGAASLSADGVIVYCNARLAEMLRQPLEQILGTALRNYLPPADREALEAVLGQARTEPNRREINLSTGDGRLVPVYLSASRVRGEGADLVFCLLLTDLREQKSLEQIVAAERLARLVLEQAADAKRAKETLREAEEKYHGLFDKTRDAMMTLEPPSWNFTSGNQAAVKMFRAKDNAEFVSRTPWETSPERQPDGRASAEKAKEMIETALREGSHFFEWTHRRGDGVEFPADVLLTRMDQGGTVMLYATVRDITAYKRTEAERVLLTTAIEQAADMVLIADRRGDIVYVNPAFASVTGYSRAEVLGRNARLLKSGVHDEAFYRAFWATISSGRTWKGRLVNKKKDGSLYSQDATISPVRDGVGVITSYVAVKRDVTRQLALESQLLQSQKMDGIGRLAGGIAHDFNNLLLVILSYTEFAIDELREDDPLKDDLREVKAAGERASALTRQLLAFSRQQVLQPEPLDLNRVLAEMEKMLRRIIGEDVELMRVQEPELGLVKADPGQVEQVIMNLVVNARDAMPTGGKITLETANVELDADYADRHGSVAPGSYVMVAVSDSGSGMDAQTIARIFEPFFTTKGLGKGTGLGLSTVHGIVNQSGGSIFVYSELGRGTTFKVYLPRELSGAAPMATKAPSVAVRTTGTETILVVEDEDALRKVARRTLAAAGYTVLTAADGNEALLICQHHAGEVHLLLTDVVMPRMGGSVLAQKLSKTRPTLKVLYMSGYSDDAIVHHGVLDAGTQFLGKPFTAADLTRKVREMLDEGRQAPT